MRFMAWLSLPAVPLPASRSTALRTIEPPNLDEPAPVEPPEPPEPPNHLGSVPYRLTNNQRKNGPPISAVMIPTGSSTGGMIVRDRMSQPTRNAAPNSTEAGSTMR